MKTPNAQHIDSMIEVMSYPGMDIGASETIYWDEASDKFYNHYIRYDLTIDSDKDEVAHESLRVKTRKEVQAEVLRFSAQGFGVEKAGLFPGGKAVQIETTGEYPEEKFNVHVKGNSQSPFTLPTYDEALQLATFIALDMRGKLA